MKCVGLRAVRIERGVGLRQMNGKKLFPPRKKNNRVVEPEGERRGVELRELRRPHRIPFHSLELGEFK